MSDPTTKHVQRVIPALRPGDQRSLSRSATRALDILEYFGEMRRPVRAIEVARRFDLHPSTVNQLLKTMVASAHLTFEAATKTYLPSPRLTRFSSWMVDVYGSDESLRSLLADVQAQSHEIVTLTTPNDLFMQVIDLVGADDHAGGAERGLRVPLFGSVVGAAYLSSLPAAEVRRLAERARIPAAAHDALHARLAHIRADGFAEGANAQTAMWSVAVALTGISFSVPLVIGLAGPAERVRARMRDLSDVLMTGAAALARKDVTERTPPT